MAKPGITSSAGSTVTGSVAAACTWLYTSRGFSPSMRYILPNASISSGEMYPSALATSIRNRPMAPRCDKVTASMRFFTPVSPGRSDRTQWR